MNVGISFFLQIIESREAESTNSDAAVQVGTLNLVDLAGSEKAEQTGATGSRFKEGTYINKSLLCLSKTINALIEQSEPSSENKPRHIPYRESKLTRLLQHSLGGNAKSVIICAVTPAVLDETRSTIGFANRAKKIENQPHVNEVLTDTAMIKRLQKQIAMLQKELNNVKSNKNQQGIIQEIMAHQSKIVRNTRHSAELARRRTWAPSLMAATPPPLISESAKSLNDMKGSTLMPPPSFFHVKASKMETNLADEIFVPAEMVDLDRSPSPTQLHARIHTPVCLRRRLSQIMEADDSPRASTVSLQDRCIDLERELIELQEFTNLERMFHVHDNRPTCEQEIKRLKHELDSTKQR